MQSTTYDAREYFAPAPNKVHAPPVAPASNAAAASGAANFTQYGPLQPAMLSQTGFPAFNNFNPFANPPPFYAQSPFGAFICSSHCIRVDAQ